MISTMKSRRMWIRLGSLPVVITPTPMPSPAGLSAVRSSLPMLITQVLLALRAAAQSLSCFCSAVLAGSAEARAGTSSRDRAKTMRMRARHAARTWVASDTLWCGRNGRQPVNPAFAGWNEGCSYARHDSPARRDGHLGGADRRLRRGVAEQGGGP